MKQILFLLLMLGFVPAFSQGPSFVKMTVASVHDGDTFVAKDSAGTKYTVRPIGFDCPEVRSNIILQTQPYGRIAGDTLRSLIKEQVVLLDTFALKMVNHRDQYGRLVAEVYFKDSSSVALFMVSSGLAWSVKTSDRTYPKMNTILKDAHREARAAKRGLWRGYVDEKLKIKQPISPWEWRKLKSLIE